MIKKKIKKKNPEVIDGEGDENDNMKTNKKWLWIGKAKQESRKWEIKEVVFKLIFKTNKKRR